MPTNPPDDVTLRPAPARDARHLNRLGQQVFGAEWASHFPQVVDLAERIFHQEDNGWVFAVASRPEQGILAVAVAKPCGAANGETLTEGSWCEVLFLAVSRDQRGAGLGSRLLDAVTDRIRSTGRSGAIASVAVDLLDWYRVRNWHVGPANSTIWCTDIRTVARGHLGSATPSDSRHPHWVWTTVDPDHPVRAWLLTPSAQPPDREMLAEAARQLSYPTPCGTPVRQQVGPPAGQVVHARAWSTRQIRGGW